MLFTSKILPSFSINIHICNSFDLSAFTNCFFFRLRLQRRVIILITFHLEGEEGEGAEEVIGQQEDKVS